jgi:hypothetical protein
LGAAQVGFSTTLVKDPEESLMEVVEPGGCSAWDALGGWNPFGFGVEFWVVLFLRVWVFRDAGEEDFQVDISIETIHSVVDRFVAGCEPGSRNKLEAEAKHLFGKGWHDFTRGEIMEG